MANNKMLIDASHPEETRVAVVRGNRIEEFDFESQAKKQIRGNIYLAKVTRVEPSLQAAFIDYGGNRHGFLAFSEIHPDYYQIPVADRLALLEEEAREASESDDDEDGGRSRRRNRNGGDRRPQGGSRNDRPARGASARDNGDETPVLAEADEDEDGFIEEPEEVTEIVHGRVSDADDADIVDDDSDNASEDLDQAAEDEDGDEPGRSMAAMVETDSISEPAPEEGEEDGEPAPEAEAAAEEKPKAKRKPAARKRKTKAEKAAEEAAAAEAAEAEAVEAAGHADMIGEAEGEPASAQHSDMAAEAEEPVTAKRGHGSDDGGRVRGVEEEEVIDSVGQEDAMEEVPFRRKLRRQYKIQEVIKRRQIMLVQVVKEERGNKGAALTTYLSLAGRYSVLMPNTARGGGISRKITNANDRKRLKAIAQELEVPRGMGVILRTAGAMRTKAEIKRDFEYLMRLWENVRTLTLSSTAPCLVYEEGSLIKRSIRDLYDKDTGEVIVSGEAGYREAKDFMRMLMPSHAKNVKPYMEEQSLFARFGVEQQLDRLLTPQVTLKSGGYIVMNQTEALVSIDVNSGRSTREHSIEDTALQTNLEAADEVARQLRLRDLAGLIVIDFIDMEEKRNNRAVEKRLKDALKHDRARIQVGRISHFGLLEMSRQRIRASVMESTMEVCPHCLGLGHVRSNSSIALHVFRSIEDYLTRHPRFDVIVRCPTGIAIDILNTKRAGLTDLEDRFGLKITVQADPSLPGQSFQIEKGEPATGIPRKSAPQYAALPADEADEFVESESEEELEEEFAVADVREVREPREPREQRDQREQREGGEDGKRRRRRRRRGRRPGEGFGPEGTEAGLQPAANGNGEDSYRQYEGEDDDNEAGTGDDENGESRADVNGDVNADGSRRKRRRGKRGGRRNRREEGENGSPQLAEGTISASDEADFDGAGEDMEIAEEVDFEESVTATTSEPAEVETREPVTTTSLASSVPDRVETEEESESRRGRNTRRPKVAEAPAPSAAEAESGDKAPEDDDKPRRSGWWARGRGFF